MNALDGVMSGDFFPADIAESVPPGTVMEPQLSRIVALRHLCTEQRRPPTPNELSGLYEAAPFDPANPRHRIFATAAARAKAEGIRRAAGVPEDKPAPSTPPQPLTLVGILSQIEAAAERLNADVAPDDHGVILKWRARPADAVILANRLAGGTVAPTEAEIKRVLEQAPHLRTSGAGDHHIPRGPHEQ